MYRPTSLYAVCPLAMPAISASVRAIIVALSVVTSIGAKILPTDANVYLAFSQLDLHLACASRTFDQVEG